MHFQTSFQQRDHGLHGFLMPFDPELQARIDAVKGGDPDISCGGLAQLKAKLAKRKGVGGYAANVVELEARIAELENGND